MISLHFTGFTLVFPTPHPVTETARPGLAHKPLPSHPLLSFPFSPPTALTLSCLVNNGAAREAGAHDRQRTLAESGSPRGRAGGWSGMSGSTHVVGGCVCSRRAPGLNSPGGADSWTDHPDSTPSLSQEPDGGAPQRSRTLQQTSPRGRGCLRAWCFPC